MNCYQEEPVKPSTEVVTPSEAEPVKDDKEKPAESTETDKPEPVESDTREGPPPPQAAQAEQDLTDS